MINDLSSLMKKHIQILLFVFVLININIQLSGQQHAVIQVDLNKDLGLIKPIWAWFGYDEPNYTYMKDGRKLLKELQKVSPVPVFVRTHNLLTSGDGIPDLKWGSTNIYTEDSNGNVVYSWTIIDSIFDTYIKLGMKPLAQIGFMPEALSIHPEPYRHHWKPGLSYSKIQTGWAYPPKDYKKWGDLIYTWVKHCVERYGKTEVENWYWEVWNEPDGAYWKGTLEEFFELYDYAADGLKRALPTAKIGGADVTGGGTKFLNAFLTHCFNGINYVTKEKGSPLDCILFHAKGFPDTLAGQVRMNISRQMRNIADNFKLIATFPKAKNIPVIIGESDPEGCAACSMKTNPENAYRNGTLYSSYTAASYIREYALAERYGINLIGAVNWSFEFENQPWFAGFRDLSTNGVDKPVLNVFRILGKIQGQRVEVKSSQEYSLDLVLDSSIRGNFTDISAIASRSAHSATIMLWNYHDLDVSEKKAFPVDVIIDHLPSNKITCSRFSIDEAHSNSYALWKKMGSPAEPNANQIIELEQAGMLQKDETPQEREKSRGMVRYHLQIPRQGVALLVLNW